jgi:hypothetical protein
VCFECVCFQCFDCTRNQANGAAIASHEPSVRFLTRAYVLKQHCLSFVCLFAGVAVGLSDLLDDCFLPTLRALCRLNSSSAFNYIQKDRDTDTHRDFMHVVAEQCVALTALASDAFASVANHIQVHPSFTFKPLHERLCAQLSSRVCLYCCCCTSSCDIYCLVHDHPMQFADISVWHTAHTYRSRK